MSRVSSQVASVHPRNTGMKESKMRVTLQKVIIKLYIYITNVRPLPS